MKMNRIINAYTRWSGITNPAQQKILKSGDYAIYNGQVYQISFDSQIVSPFRIEGIHYYKAIYKIYNITLQDNDGNKIPITSISQLESVYHISTYIEMSFTSCTVRGETNDGLLFVNVNGAQLEQIKEKILSHSQSEIDAFDVCVSIDKIDSIWYKRKPLDENFLYAEPIPFNSPKITYIKMYGQWLDEPLDE
ncbi:MAG: hypothetical protein E7069_00680 [Bacteroidales bacterium]|jgi:hypothetical protein|nr:hypothetical protein [Bacteroidales bacterium]